MANGKPGAPRKVTPENLIKDVPVYLKSTPVPILAEFAHRNGITRQYLYELAATEKEAGRHGLSDAIKELSEAKEIALEKGALVGRLNPSMARFSLKQLGWREEPVEKNDGGGITINDDFTD